MSAKTFTIKELAAANGLSVRTISRRIKLKKIDIEFAREIRFECPLVFSTEKAAAALTKKGYEVPK